MKNKTKKKRKQNHFNTDGIRTRNRSDQRQMIYPLHYKYRHVITERNSILTTVTTIRYLFVSVQRCDLKVALLLINIYID